MLETTITTRTAPRATRLTLLLGTAALALAGVTSAQAATKEKDTKYEKQTAVMCQDGTHATDKTGCEKNGGIRATNAKADGAAVQTESAKVNATGQAPTTGLPTKTPAKPDPMAK
ncbi:hypothetical protein GN316_07225 [Xylophilus sp. Kf1]|nr:hypothetical protein [Xylophilus sp. Kf1]